MALLVVAALIWVGLHLGLAGTRLRDAVMSRLGDNGFRGLFSVLSVAALWFLVHAWKAAPSEPLWRVDPAVRYGLILVMLAASILFIGSVTTKNPTAVGGETALAAGPQGMVRITRHPMLWSFGLWSLVHMIGNGDLAAQIFFGAFAVTAFAGMPSIDAKMKRRWAADWPTFANTTSILPFAAILGGRGRATLGERVPVAMLGGLVLWGALLWLHPTLFGVSALP